MSFVTALALLVGVFVGLPVLAHMLRKGRTREHDFPPAELVPPTTTSSKERRHLDDRLLLAVRGGMLLALAVLGATPLVTCSDLAVERTNGASVAVAIVLDDSHSMRGLVGDTSRLRRAEVGAKQLLASARTGDAFALVLAGKPARLLLSATTDLSAVSRALTQVSASDRDTDLPGALDLAQQSLDTLPHSDKKIVVLSDLEDALPSALDERVRFPLPELAKKAPNCGVASATEEGQNVVVTLGCNSPQAAAGRSVELLVRGDSDAPVQAAATLQAVVGVQRQVLRRDALGLPLAVRLTGRDQLANDDEAPVAAEVPRETIAIVVDSARASAATGGPTVIEQALGALNADVVLRPLATVPDNAEDLSTFDAVLLDDPAGLSPEARGALTAWLENGHAALALLGPNAASSQLASSLQPFIREGAPWEAHDQELDPDSLSWLGPGSDTLDHVRIDSPENGRLRLDGADLPDSTVVGRWSDGVPWLLRRNLGAGIVLAAGLPASVDNSDLALRPGFLTLLQWLLDETRARTGGQMGGVGDQWLFPASAHTQVVGPDGPLKGKSAVLDGVHWEAFVPELAGLYQVTSDGTTRQRIAVLKPEELTRSPAQVPREATNTAQGGRTVRVDASPKWALFVLALFALELLIRHRTGRGRVGLESSNGYAGV